MTADLAALRTRLRPATARPQKPPWSPPGPGDFRQDMTVLAFDPSLSNTAWVMLSCRDGRVHAYDLGMIRPQTPLTGYWQTWEKAEQIRKELARPLRYAEKQVADAVVAEAPPVGGGIRRDDSSLVAGLQVYQAFCQLLPVGTVASHHVCKVMCGRVINITAARKGAIRDAVCRLIPAAERRPWNEHLRDAAAAGLTYLFDLAHQEGTPDD